ncbi:hypothetical protein KIPB_004017 [Kipferlia bialata]|uniref:4Fe-4S ferredoxin-type domain-containing protein n=1 Tax=Kipferlia bialata TaxID=797122 RepID=A0A9K3GHG3_9EUKA|nr:hypothetical protein KIPB_004017 [Kipferlia bialata]|eukprot:g4017.t1
MRVSVLFSSSTGHTRAAAEHVRDGMETVTGVSASLCSMVPLYKRLVAHQDGAFPEADAYVFAAWPMFHRPQAFVQEYAKAFPPELLRDKPVAVFCTSQGAPGRLYRVIAAPLRKKGALIASYKDFDVTPLAPPCISQEREASHSETATDTRKRIPETKAASISEWGASLPAAFQRAIDAKNGANPLQLQHETEADPSVTGVSGCGGDSSPRVRVGTNGTPRACTLSHPLYQRIVGPVVVDPDLCVGCGACASACPYDNIVIEGIASYDPAHGSGHPCEGCMSCVSACPNRALSVSPAWVCDTDTGLPVDACTSSSDDAHEDRDPPSDPLDAQSLSDWHGSVEQCGTPW